MPDAMRKGIATLMLALVPGLACSGEPGDADSAASPPPSSPPVAATPAPPASVAGALFIDASEESGLGFVHWNGMTGRFYMPENMGAGGALGDFDNDGDLDLYLIQGRLLGPGAKLEDALIPPPGPLPLSDRLYRNDLEKGRVRFTDVSARAGLEAAAGYGMGAASGDFDNDGDLDLYVTAFGPNRLLRNGGDGTFEDVTTSAGVDDERWSVPALFFDFDRDGWLDLFVGHYLDFSYEKHRPCTTTAGALDYCDPEVYAGVGDRLWRNRGDGTFEDVTRRAGLGEASDKALGKALGAVAADFNGDGWLDLYVGNDGQPNHLWINQGDGTFVDEALFAGCAVNGDGRSEASMGVDAGDFDNDGDLDLFLTHFADETHTLFQNDGRGLFTDVTSVAGLAASSLEANGFGAGLVDLDGDGVLDVVAVNGAVRAVEALAGELYPFHQRNQVFRGLGDGRFAEAAGEAVLAVSEVSRGALFGDVDNDGDLDVVVSNNAGPARLWLNAAGAAQGFVGLRLLTGTPPRDALGAWVGLVRSGAPVLWRRAATDGSYAAARDPRVLFGLGGGEEKGPFTVHVHWPGGRREVFDGVAAGRYTDLIEGTGRVANEREEKKP